MELALCSLSEYLYRYTTPEDAAKAQKVKLARIDSLLLLSNQVRWKLEIILQICDALQYLHRFNILHRDLKSPNVLLFFDAAKNKVIAKIGDFGLALAVDFITRTTTGHMVSKMSTFLPNAVGTYNYMAPELFERQPGESVAYSESSDVYSLGILINEIMSGTMPWGGGAREVDIMNWVAHKALRPEMWTMSSSSSAAEKELWAIVGQSDSAAPSCLHQSPSNRFTAHDVFRAASGSAKKAVIDSNKPAVADTKMPAHEADSVLIITDADGSLIEAFASELVACYNDISEENAKKYAASLFRLSITTLGRLQQQVLERNQQEHGAAVIWLEALGFHSYDIADVTGKHSHRKYLRSEEALKLQGVTILDNWMKSHVTNINIPRVRQQWAQLLWDNNITTAHRLLNRGDDLPFLQGIGISDMDARDIADNVRGQAVFQRTIWYQWYGSDADVENVDARNDVRCCRDCCEIIMSPLSLQLCLCLVPYWLCSDEKRCGKSSDERCVCCCWCCSMPVMLPVYMTLGGYICCYVNHFARKNGASWSC
jgi:serine/threonine protein kinase